MFIKLKQMKIFKRVKQQHPVKAIAEKFRILERLEKGSLLFWDKKKRQLLISLSLASIYLPDQKKWRSFLENVNQWIYYRESSDAWEELFKSKETEELRKATRKFSMLSKADMRRIRQEARMSVDVSAINKPEVLPYQFVVVSGAVIHAGENAVLAGIYKDGVFDIIPWKEIARQARSIC